MNKEKTMEQRIINYSNHNSLDRHMPPTPKKTYLIYLLASPILACGFWLVLLYLCVKES